MPSATTSACSPTSAREASSRPSSRCASSSTSATASRTSRCRTSSRPLDSGKPDYVGGFVVTAGIEEVAIAERFERANDDYCSILVKALADRFAEAFAERMHERVGARSSGAMRADETFAPDELIGEPYQGIRPAPGYPAQPDHTEKATLFRLLDAEQNAGVRLTESIAMWPGSSVSGLYLSHPESYYFGVAKIERDQVEDYARTQGHDASRRSSAGSGRSSTMCPLAMRSSPHSKSHSGSVGSIH